MKILFVIVLFLAAFIPGIIIIYLKRPLKINLKNMLIFAGAYIFSITIVHLLPELIHQAPNPKMIGIYVLAGFFMQIFIDFLTSGVEHGHIHHDHDHQVSFSPLLLMIGLCLHALMDGSVLIFSGDHTNENLSVGMLIGIILHKIPAAIVLISVFLATIKSLKKVFVWLVIFSIASPLGLIFSDYLHSSQIFSQDTFTIIFAIVSGNFLHISTTIYFETSPDHSFNRKKILFSLLGASLAIAVELFQH